MTGHEESRKEVYLTRIDPDADAFRFYSLQVQPSLFEGYALLRAWGRIGQNRTEKIELYTTYEEACRALKERHMQKQARGYSPTQNGIER